MTSALAPDPRVGWSRAARRRALRSTADTVRSRFRLPPKLSLSQWADEYRVVSPEASSQSGRWQTSRVPYLREIMDTISGRDHQDITIVKCSQSGGSEVLLNAMGFYMDQEPSAMLVIQPNVKPMAEGFSKTRVAPMIRDCTRLADKVKDPRSRDSGNTITQKTFPGGTMFIMGANSPAGLASNPIRVVLADELDRWPASAGTEGDPLMLAEARQITYRHRKKTVKVSSPGNEAASRIEKEWEKSDQRHYYVPCPHCGHEQPLEWRASEKPGIKPGKGDYRLVWDKVESGETAEHKPETAAYCCRSCGTLIEETYKPAMLLAGRWVKHNPKSKRAGFHISGLLSPWVRWSEIAAKWLAVKDDDEQRKGFFNTLLGLLYVGAGETLDLSQLSKRREAYAADVPMGVGILTMFIDVQDDRIECDVWGWGVKEEAWHIRLERIVGDPDGLAVWESAERLLNKAWTHESGGELRIRVCVVDSGYKQDSVFRFVKARQHRGVFASKGVENAKQPLSRATRANRDGVKVFNVNPTSFKDVLFSRLKKEAAGPGYMHYGPEDRGADDNYFAQYEAEKRITDWSTGRPVIKYKQVKKRNEAIDLYVGNLVALRTMGLVTSEALGSIVAKVQEEGAATKAAAERVAQGQPEADEDAPQPAPRRRANWATGGGKWGLR